MKSVVRGKAESMGLGDRDTVVVKRGCVQSLWQNSRYGGGNQGNANSSRWTNNE